VKPESPISEDSIIWNTLAWFPSRFRSDLVWRTGLRPADVGSFLAKLAEGPESSESIWQAGVGDGRIRVVERLQDKDKEALGLHRDTVVHIEKLRVEAKSLGGNLIIEHAPAAIKNLASAWGTFGASAGIMQRTKHQLDPHDILSPGRFQFCEVRGQGQRDAALASLASQGQ